MIYNTGIENLSKLIHQMLLARNPQIMIKLLSTEIFFLSLHHSSSNLRLVWRSAKSRTKKKPNKSFVRGPNSMKVCWVPLCHTSPSHHFYSSVPKSVGEEGSLLVSNDFSFLVAKPSKKKIKNAVLFEKPKQRGEINKFWKRIIVSNEMKKVFGKERRSKIHKNIGGASKISYWRGGQMPLYLLNLRLFWLLN